MRHRSLKSSRRFLIETLERRVLLAADSPPPLLGVTTSHSQPEGEEVARIENEGEVDSEQTLSVGTNGGGFLKYEIGFFRFGGEDKPGKFSLKYDGKVLFDSEVFVGVQKGEVSVPRGNADFVTLVIDVQAESGNYTYRLISDTCGSAEPYDFDLTDGEFVAMEEEGKTVCRGTGTLTIGRTDGIGAMLRVENATASYDDEKLEVSGTFFSTIGTDAVKALPLFTGSFELPFEDSTVSSFSEDGGGGTGEFQAGGMDIDFSGLTINPNGLALGASFELLESIGFPQYLFSGPDGLQIFESSVTFGPSIKFSTPNFADFQLLDFLPVAKLSDFSIEYIGPENAVKIQGKLELKLETKSPVKKIVADMSGPKFLQIKGGEVDVVGELTVETDLKFPPKGWGLNEVRLSIDTINKDVSGGAKLTLPFKSKVNVEGDIGFKLPIPPLELNKLSLSVDNLNVPIPAYPQVFFQGFRGAAENFAASDNDPIEFSGGVSATLGPQFQVPTIGNVSLVRADLDGKISSEQLSATGTVTIVHPTIATQSSTATLNWNKKFFESSGALNILDGAITTNDKFRASSNFDVHMGGAAAVGIPKSVPLFGGAQIGSGNYAFQFSNNGNLGDDFAAGWGTLTISKLGFEINLVAGFKGFFDGRVERIGAKNIPIVGSWDIAADTPWFVVGADWENEVTTDVPLVVIKPDGTRIEEADFAANNIAVVDELTDSTTKVVVVFEPEPGIWDLEVADETGLGAISYSAAEDAAAPTIVVTAPDQDVAGGSATIGFDAFDSDSNAEVKLFYDVDDSGLDGVLIAEGIEETDGAGTFQWDTSGIATGDYFIYAMISDGDNPPEYSYSSGRVQVSDEIDLSVSQHLIPDLCTEHAGDVSVGEEFSIAYTVSNLGNVAATNNTVSIVMPENTVLVSASIQPSSVDGNVATFAIDSLAAGATALIEIQYTAPDLPAILFSRITAIGGGALDGDATNDADEITVPVSVPVELTDLTVSLDSQTTTPAFGDSYTYVVAVTNKGLTPATGVRLQEQLGNLMVFEDVQPDQGTGTFDPATRMVSVDIGDLAVGATTKVEFTVQSRGSGALVSSSAVSNDQEDSYPLDNFLFASSDASFGEADLELSISSDVESAGEGDEVVITVNVQNSGPAEATNVQVTNRLGAAFVVSSATVPQGTFDESTGVWNVGSIAAGGEVDLIVRATVIGMTTPRAVSEITYTANPDPDSTANNGEAGEDDIDTLALMVESTISEDVAASILTPATIARPHLVPASEIDSAILFRATQDTPITVAAIAPETSDPQVSLLDEHGMSLGAVVDGTFTASLVEGKQYALIFAAQSEQQLYAVASPEGTAALEAAVLTNILQPTDVDGNATTTTLDALVVINRLAVESLGDSTHQCGAIERLYDVNRDGNTTSLDALFVINELGRRSNAESEMTLAESEYIAKQEVEGAAFINSSSVKRDQWPIPLEQDMAIGSFARVMPHKAADFIEYDQLVSHSSHQASASEQANHDRAISELATSLELLSASSLKE